MITYVLLVAFFLDGLEQGRIKLPGWSTLQTCEAAGERASAEWTGSQGIPVSVRFECKAGDQ